MAFDFYEIYEKGANSAVVSFQKGVNRLIGDFAMDNMLKRFCFYKKGEGNSMIENFKYVPATAVTRDNKTVDLAKIESDYIRGGRTEAARTAYMALITQVKTQRYRMQVFPKSYIIESEPLNRREAITLGGGDASVGFAATAGDDSFIRPLLASETYENNVSFLGALKDVVTNGFTFKKTGWDGAPNTDGDGNDMTVALPEYCKYSTVGAFIAPKDLIRIRAQAQNNMTDAPELQRPMTILISPNTAAEMLINNTSDQDILHKAMFGNKGAGDTAIPTAYGFSFYVHPLVPDKEAYAIVPGVTLGVFDWGLLTMSKDDSDVWTVNTIRRSPNYGVKVVQPLSFIHITITGKTDEYDGDRLDGITTTTDEALKPIRKKASV